MKVIILAGGLGTRLEEETSEKPKPMVVVHDKPIIQHLMEIYLKHGFNEFVVALGYKGDVIKRWIIDLNILDGDLQLDILSGKIERTNKSIDPSLNIMAIETGISSQTGGRILNCMKLLPKQRVMATYGDGLGNIDITNLVKFHNNHGKIATLTAVRPPSRFGQVEILDSGAVDNFGEKVQSKSGWINGGFFVFEPEIVNFISDENEPLETGALPRLAKLGQLMAYKHEGFWKPMDTIREKNELTRMAQETPVPWLNF